MSSLSADEPALDDASGNPSWEGQNRRRRALISRICASRHFRRAAKLRAFLNYICDAALDGRADELKEHRVGTDVFKRKTGYNMAEDNIVRVEARTLRTRLQRYFDEEGSEEPLIIRVPLGGYVPEFVERRAPVEPRFSFDSSASKVDRRVWLFVVPALIVAVLLGAAFSKSAGGSAVPTATGIGDEARRLYSILLDWPANRETLVVLSNPRVLLFRRFEEANPSGQPGLIPAPSGLEAELSGSLNNESQPGDHYFFQRQPYSYTGMGEAASAYHVGLLMDRLGVPTRLTQGRFLDWESVRSDNLIVLGSPHINNWTLDNIPKGVFTLVEGGVADRREGPGKGGVYRTTIDSNGNIVRDHGVISLFDLGDSKTLILAGRSSAGTYGVGEFFFNQEQMASVYDSLTSNGTAPVPNAWQALVCLEIHENLPVKADLVATEALR